MIVTALIENTKPQYRQDLLAERGLCLHIRHNDRGILFDTGITGGFSQNADQLGIPIQEVEASVISHHHFDHGGGLGKFLDLNSGARIYLRKSATEEFYLRAWGGIIQRKIGLRQELLDQHAERYVWVEDATEILPGVFLLTHIESKHPLPRGNRYLFVRQGGEFVLDNFKHELILVIQETDGLVIFTGCSHNGILNMLGVVIEQFVNQPIKAIFGGFHLIGLPWRDSPAIPANQVREIASCLSNYPIGKIFTGHCTGVKGYKLLKSVLGDQLEYFSTGRQIELS